MKNAQEILYDFTDPPTNLSDYIINDIKTDSRLVKKNDLFIAIKGHTVDGHQYIDDAIKNGASIIIANEEMKDKISRDILESAVFFFVKDTYDYLSDLMNRFVDYPSRKLNVIGITGTNGKTTTTNILYHILNLTNNKTGLLGTVGASAENYSKNLQNTTPDPLVLQNILKDMVDLDIKNIVMEVSSIGLTEKRTKGTDFSIAIFTNLTHDHLDFHQTMEQYKEAKGNLFKHLNSHNIRGEENFAIINNDEETADYFKKVTKATVVSYGLTHEADYQAINIEYSRLGTTFDLLYKGEKYRVETPLIGEINVYNVLAAIVAAHVKFLSLEEIIPTLKTIQPVKGRLEILTDADDDITVVIDYAHTPVSLEKTLKNLHELDYENIISVFGCNGDRDRLKRPLMAQISLDNSTFSIFTTGNPRTEDQRIIFNDMTDGLVGGNYLQITNREAAIKHSILTANEGALILIAGKGHEDYQIVGREKIHFDDHEVALKALDERKKRLESKKVLGWIK